MRGWTRRVFALVITGALAATTLACSTEATDNTGAETTTDMADGAWPRTIEHELGETVIEQPPQRIVNTAASITGTLLAMNAPVIASAATDPSGITDDKGFFSQWADEADAVGVDVLYPGSGFDLESLIVEDPDLVILSVSGTDSVSENYEQIAAQFPTIAVDYSRQSWQELATELGEALGLEDEAQQAIDDFDAYIENAAAKIKAPGNGAAIVSYNGPDGHQGVAKAGGPHADLMEALGVQINEAPEELDTSEQAHDDFAFFSMENLSRAITGDAVFLLSGTDETVAEFTGEPALANLDAVQNGAVHPLGPTSFRIDPYSGREVADAVVAVLGE